MCVSEEELDPQREKRQIQLNSRILPFVWVWFMCESEEELDPHREKRQIQLNSIHGFYLCLSWANQVTAKSLSSVIQ
jgi:hypothetical protein